MRFAVLMALVATSEAINIDRHSKGEPMTEINRINAAANSAAKNLETATDQNDINKASESAADSIRSIGAKAIEQYSSSKSSVPEKDEDEGTSALKGQSEKSIDE